MQCAPMRRQQRKVNPLDRKGETGGKPQSREGTKEMRQIWHDCRLWIIMTLRYRMLSRGEEARASLGVTLQ